MTTQLFTDVWNDSSTAEGNDKADTLPWSAFPLYNVAFSMWRFYTPVILCGGTFGNVMTIGIMQRLTSGESNVNVYFTATAVMDILVLYFNTLGFVIQRNFGYDVKITSSAFCKLHTWLHSVAAGSSCWYVVCMTVHRATSVVWPHRVNVMCTRRTVLLLLAGTTVFFAALYSHYFFGFDVYSQDNGTSYICHIPTEGYLDFSVHIFIYVESLVSSVLPFAMLMGSNSVLVWKLVDSVRKAGRNLSQGGDSSDQVKAREKSTRSVTVTVMVVSMTFLLLTLPASVNFMWYFANEAQIYTSRREVVKAYFTTTVCELLAQTNSAVNFFLYCLTGRRFREEFIRVLVRGCGRDRPRRGAHH